MRPRGCARPPRPAPRTAGRSPRRSPRRRCATPPPGRPTWRARRGGRRAPGPRPGGRVRRRRASPRARPAPPAPPRAAAGHPPRPRPAPPPARRRSRPRPPARPGRAPASARHRRRRGGVLRSCASPTVPRRRSASVESRYQVSCAAASRGASWASGVLQPLLLGAGDGELLLDLEAAGPGDRLVRLLAGQLAAQGHEVVRGQPQARVAQLGLHRLGPPGDLRLPAQRLELAAQLAREVRQPREVGLHRVQLPQRLLLALAVLEDACGLLDVRATVFRARTAARSRAGPARRRRAAHDRSPSR